MGVSVRQSMQFLFDEPLIKNGLYPPPVSYLTYDKSPACINISTLTILDFYYDFLLRWWLNRQAQLDMTNAR